MKIHKEGRIIILVTALIILIINAVIAWRCDFGIVFSIIAALSLIYFFFTCRFFRVPALVPVTGNDLIVSAADGKVVIVEETFEAEYLKTRCIQVSVFMSVFNVHANYFPMSGVVEYYKYHPGKYMVAWHPKSSEKNERTTVVVNNNNGTKILFRQIAGLLARRIVCYAKEGASATQGTETGFIKFGSRVDLFLPLDAEINVKVGDKVQATQTIIAHLK